MHSQQRASHQLPWVCTMSYFPCWSKHSRQKTLGGIRVSIKRSHPSVNLVQSPHADAAKLASLWKPGWPRCPLPSGSSLGLVLSLVNPPFSSLHVCACSPVLLCREGSGLLPEAPPVRDIFLSLGSQWLLSVSKPGHSCLPCLSLGTHPCGSLRKWLSMVAQGSGYNLCNGVCGCQ